MHHYYYHYQRRRRKWKRKKKKEKKKKITMEKCRERGKERNHQNRKRDGEDVKEIVSAADAVAPFPEAALDDAVVERRTRMSTR